MTDTHTHIYEPEFDIDRSEMMSRAAAAGVSRMLLPNINEESIPRMMSMVADYPKACRAMMGLHPEDVKADWTEVLDRMELVLRSAGRGTFVAVGEVGLDFYWDETFRKEQIEAFERQIGWARDLDLPLVIHTRKAEPELLRIMDRHRGDGLRGIFHCFGGSIETAVRLLKYEGFCLGIGGVVTFKKSRLPETLRRVPLDRIVLETDAPYMAPTPHRGKRNEPAFVRDIAEFVAGVYGTGVDVVERVTDANALRVFGTL